MVQISNLWHSFSYFLQFLVLATFYHSFTNLVPFRANQILTVSYSFGFSLSLNVLQYLLTSFHVLISNFACYPMVCVTSEPVIYHRRRDMVNHVSTLQCIIILYYIDIFLVILSSKVILPRFLDLLRSIFACFLCLSFHICVF